MGRQIIVHANSRVCCSHGFKHKPIGKSECVQCLPNRIPSRKPQCGNLATATHTDPCGLLYGNQSLHDSLTLPVPPTMPCLQQREQRHCQAGCYRLPEALLAAADRQPGRQPGGAQPQLQVCLPRTKTRSLLAPSGSTPAGQVLHTQCSTG